MNIKKLKSFFVTDNVDDYETETERDEDTSYTFTSIKYGELLGLSRRFSFILLKTKLANDSEFNDIKKAAVDILKQDIARLGENFYEIDPGLRNKLMGSIGALVLVCDTENNVSIRFHKRDENGIWDASGKTYPEKFLTSEEKSKIKFKHEIFFILEDDED